MEEIKNYLETNIQTLTEEDVSCYLAERPLLQDYVIELLYESLKILGKEKIIANKTTFIEKYDDDVLTNIGFDETFFKEVVESLNGIDVFKSIFEDKPKKYIHVNLGILNNIYPPDKVLFKELFFKLDHMKNKLSKNFKSFLNLPNDYTFNDFNELHNKINNKYLIGYFLYMADTECYISLYRRNLSYEPYIRKRIMKNVSIHRIDDTCLNDYEAGKKILKADNYYDLENTLTIELYKKYGRTYLSGPSGSAVLLFNFATKVLKKEPTILLLLISIIELIPLYHTMTEIFETIFAEYNHYEQYRKIIEKYPYKLDIDPKIYLLHVLNHFPTTLQNYHDVSMTSKKSRIFKTLRMMRNPASKKNKTKMLNSNSESRILRSNSEPRIVSTILPRHSLRKKR